MSGRLHDIHGKVVPEEEVAKDLGFADVHELRRWQSEQGRKVMELEYALKRAQDARDRFRSVGMKMQSLLERIEPALKGLICGTDPKEFDLRRLRLAIGVVCGKEVDWDKELKGWFDS